jgi:hypothetical protein
MRMRMRMMDMHARVHACMKSERGSKEEVSGGGGGRRGMVTSSPVVVASELPIMLCIDGESGMSSP